MLVKVNFPRGMKPHEAVAQIVTMFGVVFVGDDPHPQIVVKDFEIYVEAGAAVMPQLEIPLPRGFSLIWAEAAPDEGIPDWLEELRPTPDPNICTCGHLNVVHKEWVGCLIEGCDCTKFTSES